MSFAILVFFTVIGGQVFGRNILENETNDLNRELDGITGETELLIQPLGSDNHLKGMVDGGLDHSRTDTAVTASLRLLDNLSHQVEISLSQISSLFKNLVKTSLRVVG